jgi:hypothetical protein
MRARCEKWDVLVVESALLPTDVAATLPFAMRPILIAIDSGSHAAGAGSADFFIPSVSIRPALQRVMQLVISRVMAERQRYFRCPVELECRITAGSQTGSLAMLTNISQGGAACTGAPNLASGEQVILEFASPATPENLVAVAIVIWADGKGAAGLRFTRMAETHRQQLWKWLAEVFREGLGDPEPVREIKATLAMVANSRPSLPSHRGKKAG